VVDSIGPLTISAVYFPSNHIVAQEQLDSYYNSLGKRFIAGGDYNAKHSLGNQTYYIQRAGSLQNDGTPSPTPSLHWPSDLNKLLDLVDFCITKDIPPTSATAMSCLDLSSDHSPVLVSLAN
jgi:endonuclease/exonuclease/phosphatase family metal-dependent hydrolase